MNSIKLCLGSVALASLLAVIIATPALAVETPQVMPWGTVIMPPLKVTAKPCVVRQLVQGSGNVRVCG